MLCFPHPTVLSKFAFFVIHQVSFDAPIIFCCILNGNRLSKTKKAGQGFRLKPDAVRNVQSFER